MIHLNIICVVEEKRIDRSWSFEYCRYRLVKLEIEFDYLIIIRGWNSKDGHAFDRCDAGALRHLGDWPSSQVIERV